MHLDNGHMCEHVEAARFKNPKSMDVVHLVDLQPFLNLMLFNCTSQPGLSLIFMHLLGFEGFAFRSKRAKDLDLVTGPSEATNASPFSSTSHE